MAISENQPSRSERAGARVSEDGVDMQACGSATGRPTRRYSGYFQTITHDGEMSTTSRSTPAHRSPRRDLELALGVEINALLSASRALDVRTAAAFHPDLQPAAFHLARWLYAYGPAKPSALAEAVETHRRSTSTLIGSLKSSGRVATTPAPAR